MEPHQQHEDSGSSSKNSSFLCRQSSTRWIPTADQIRILRELYYNNGVRSPNADQIQRISARLRQYGKIEGKNVFYWFQNHKARERQKKRFTHNVDVRGGWKVEGKYNSYIGGNGGSSSHGVLGVGQMGSNGCGSVLMENSFRDCSLSGSSNHGRGFESSYGFLDNKISEEREKEISEIETLPLFPIHGEETAGFCQEKTSGDYFSDLYFDEDDNKGGSSASLELSLNSYSAGGYTGP